MFHLPSSESLNVLHSRMDDVNKLCNMKLGLSSRLDAHAGGRKVKLGVVTILYKLNKPVDLRITSIYLIDKPCRKRDIHAYS